jgi:hypothetical protein
MQQLCREVQKQIREKLSVALLTGQKKKGEGEGYL